MQNWKCFSFTITFLLVLNTVSNLEFLIIWIWAIQKIEYILGWEELHLQESMWTFGWDLLGNRLPSSILSIYPFKSNSSPFLGSLYLQEMGRRFWYTIFHREILVRIFVEWVYHLFVCSSTGHLMMLETLIIAKLWNFNLLLKYKMGSLSERFYHLILAIWSWQLLMIFDSNFFEENISY